MAASPAEADGAVEFYWRPGCPFCVSLRRGLRRRGIPIHPVNIWDDPAAAGRVREVADGNETVPTVFVGDRSMVNPSAGQVEALVRECAPDLLDQVAPQTGLRRWFSARRPSDG